MPFLPAIPGKEDRLVILLDPADGDRRLARRIKLLTVILHRREAAWRAPLFAVLGIAAFGWTTIAHPTPVITGYREAADRVGELAPRNGRVVCCGATRWIVHLQSTPIPQ